MPTLPIKPTTLLLVLTLLLNSCAPQLSSPQGAIPELIPTIEQPPTSVQISPTPTEKPRGQNPPQSQGSDASQSLNFDIPAHTFDVILGRPTSNSVTFSLLAYTDQTLSISYGTESGNYTLQTEPIALKANIPQTFQLSNLQPSTEYFYSINGGTENTFHTARPVGSTFIFTIQADSHLDSNVSAQVYLQTLANQRADNPDFVIDMGDTFMTDKYKPYTDAAPQYLAQRYLMGQLGMPLFLVLGNHDGEGAPRGKTGEEMSVWSAQLRTQYFLNPIPNEFYSGNTTPHPTVGDLQNYYAWEWGDALFIVLDPYWFTPPTKGNTSDLWNPTLGEEQYQWLKSTLETSNAKWKFVSIHQLIGGLDKDGRGGVEVAPFHEWGGLNPDGTYAFDQFRPNWELPIHQLLITNHVTAVFHGHDHLFVHQELDGIVYQEVPQPGSARPNSTDSAADYGYLNGAILGGPGHLRVTVNPEQVTVEYVRSYVDKKPDQKNGRVDYSYTIK
jgi:predicted phosphodiesterase